VVDDELKVVTFPGVVVGKGIIVVALVRLLLDLGGYVAVGVVALVAVAEDLIVRLEEEEEGLGDLTTACNGDAEPFTTLLKEAREENKETEIISEFKDRGALPLWEEMTLVVVREPGAALILIGIEV
jgi:hypothetical protein